MRDNSEQERQGSAGRAAGILMTLMLFLCIIAVAFFSYQRSLDPSIEMKDVIKSLGEPGEKAVREADALYAFSFDPREKTAFTQYKDFIVKCSKSGVMFLDKTGEIARSESISYADPMVKTNGSQILIADIGSTEISVLDADSVRWQDKTDMAILNADISEDGYVTVITAAKRDNNYIRVYEPHGIEMFRKIIANDFAVSSMASPSGKYLALSAISTGAVGPYSRFKFYDMQGKELSEISFDVSGKLLPLFWYDKEDSIFAVGDSEAAFITPAGETLWEEQFRSVSGAGPVGQGMFAVAAAGDGGAALNLYTADGKKHVSAELDGSPAGLEAIKGRICVYNEDTAYFFDEKANVTSQYYFGKKIRQICMFSKSQAAVITDGEVTILGIY